MRHLKIGLVISMLSSAFSSPYFSADQLNVTMTLAEYFNIAFCVFGIERRIMEAISHKKHPSIQKLLTVTMNVEGITNLVAGINSSIKEGRTMAVMRMNNETLILLHKDPPYVMIAKNEKGDFAFTGFLFELWSELEYRLNFTTEFSSKYFEDDPKIVLESKEVDFAVARIFNDPNVFNVMDLSQPISEAKTYLFGHRRGAELDWDSYLKPFSANTWVVNLIWMIFSAVALTLLYKIAWNYETSEREADYFIYTFSESMLTVFRAICMQGSDNTPRSGSCRLFFLSIYLSALIVTSAFSAALFSLLTVPKPRNPFKDSHEILQNKKFKIGFPSDPNFLSRVEDFSNYNSSSKLSNVTILRNLLDSAEKNKISAQEGLQRLCYDKFYVFMFDLPSVLNLMQTMTRSCQDKILPSGPPLFTNYISFGFTKNNPYKKLIDYHITQIKNDGIFHRILLNYWPPKIPTVQAKWVRVTLSDISPILYMFVIGLIFGVIILHGEKIFYHLKRKAEKARHIPLDDDSLIIK